MDKIKVNNQVVSMRKFVKQAKIFAINKCTKQIKFLENRKGNEEQMTKTKRKLQRLLEEVNILKKIKPDSVSKLALSKAKDWKAVLAEKNVPLEDRCYAMLANHLPVQKTVEKFHNDNSELIPKIPELVKHWEEKKSRSSQISKKKPKGSQNATGPNTVPIGNKNNAHESSQAQIKHQRIESLESLSDISDFKSIKNSTPEQNLAVEKTTKRKESSGKKFDKLNRTSDLTEPVKEKLLIVDDAKSNESDYSLSDCSDFGNHPISQTKKKLRISNKRQSLVVNDGKSDEYNDSLSGDPDIAKRHFSQTKEKLSISNQKQSLGVDDVKSDESGDSISDSPNFSRCHISQTKKLPISNKAKSCQFNNVKESKSFIRNHQTNSSVKKTLTDEEAVDDDDSSQSEVESNGVEHSGKLQDIRSKLLQISMSKTKVQSKPRNKSSSVVHQLNADVETDSGDECLADAHRKLDNSGTVPKKAEVKNKIKAITMLDLNELQDVDEIPIEKSDSDDEDETDEDAEKQKKDPFFLHDGEPVSESDNDENSGKETVRKQGFPLFKKGPYGNLNRRERRGNSFPQRRFEKHSVDGRNSNFRENNFAKNKELLFKDNKRGFKRTFDDNSEFIPNKNIKFASKDKFSNRNGTNNFAKNPKEEFRQNKNFKFASKNRFNNRNGANNFAKNPKEKFFSQSHSRDSKRNNYPSNPSLSNPTKTVNDDKPLHPSWEAKKKLKEAAALKFQGKRIVFND